ncbi:MAG: glutamyl-tRNA reductase [Acutalibacteraceae bacterium]
MFVLSLSYKTSSAKDRESFCFGEEKTEQLLKRLALYGMNEAVYLFTCNRIELYAVGDAYKAFEILCAFAAVQAGKIKSQIMIFEGKAAVRHLFRVTGGFESMVVGEDEILGQVKKAYSFSKERGFTGYELNTVFQSAVRDAKRIKTETLLSKSSVSVASLAASCCKNFKSGKKTVLMIGASGETGRTTLRNLLSYGEFEIFAAVRRAPFFEKGVTTIDYSRRYDYTDRSDIIISATKSPHFTVIKDIFLENCKTQKPRLFVDLSAVHDIDPEIAGISGAKLITIDDFEKIAKSNNEQKRKELHFAEQILDGELDSIYKQLSFHRFYNRYEDRLKENETFLSFLYQFRNISNSEEWDSFLGVLERAVKNGDSFPVF